ncbi:hypothetical protein SRB17_45500 [Streptomyces sp. RB17]|uniref:hypothetical protein n=1 Tax=Streptomyces sp. RB17 TaxID=2585197 RepID=UPI001297BEDF|nr:hypothetical protein [Streptomyces sp. RB17]MQY36548.1 hypothetical protein [Streptomyces sp. RB17]
MIVRVPRAELGVDLVNAKALLSQVLSGDLRGTLPEMELLARGLPAAGVAAVAVRPWLRQASLVREVRGSRTGIAWRRGGFAGSVRPHRR